ncbi:COQ9 family protein [Anianabacter salinae]|uniref:COQ9 family protein n=1 Tax=Anianabacter salinae TaxID=2851023 RepID=UPI00225E1CFF|nr:COQ9 family protein [Anianabacter salinae]MBV0910811.1 COQ9 family protein [Anianabacter salinae]
MIDPTSSPETVKTALVDAILPHVAFDGWSEPAFRAACRDAGVSTDMARAVCPKGAVDLAIAYHRRADDEMARKVAATDLSAMRFRDRVAQAVRWRVEAIDDREAVRRASSLFALPMHAAEGARLIWGTADRIWDALGDPSDDINWYTKRATLSGVYGSVVLYWLGDDSTGHQATWAFLDRRIDDVMRIEKAKAQVNANPVLKRVFAGPNWLMSKVKAPTRMPQVDLPGHWTPKE